MAKRLFVLTTQADAVLLCWGEYDTETGNLPQEYEIVARVCDSYAYPRAACATDVPALKRALDGLDYADDDYPSAWK